MSDHDFHFSNINLLIYEEYSFLSDVLSKMLNAFGLSNIYKASSLMEAKRICEKTRTKDEKERIDFAIIDLAAPNNSGLKFMQWLRYHEDTTLQYVPVIFTTNDARQKIIIDSRDQGVNEILVKPYTAFNISRRLLSVINHPRMFVQAPNYAGPNRRRKDMDFKGTNRRETEESEVEVIYEKHDTTANTAAG